MSEVLTLVAEDLSRREVLAKLRSVGMQEFYAAQTSNYRPELKFVLADYLDYEDEAIAIHEGQVYRIVRTYRAGQALELTCERASLEEARAYG